MKTKLAILLSTMIFMCLASCSSDSPDERKISPRYEITLNHDRSGEKDNANLFAFRVWSELEKMDDKSNVMIAPFSMFQTLSIAANGADDEAEAELLSLLGGNNGTSIRSLNDFNNFIINELPKVDPAVTLALANSVWLENSLKPMADFSNLCADIYRAPLYSFQKNSAEALHDINQWCATNTNGKINNFLDREPEQLFMILNSCYFEGQWCIPMKKSETTKQTFYSLSGAKNQIDMMAADAMGGYCEKCFISKLNYGNGGYAMYLILPEKGYSVADCLTAEVFNSTTENSMEGINLYLPKFGLNYTSVDWEILFANCGLKKIMNGSARFNKIADEQLQGNRILQKTAIDVSESGTTAAVVSEFGGGAIAPAMSHKMNIVLDRPFGFIITETSTGLILFIGQVNEL